MKLLLLLFCFFGLIKNVEAAECQIGDDITTYFAIDYESVPYCSNGRNLRYQGCYPLTVASILKSYGKNTTPQDVSSWLCSNYYDYANTVKYTIISGSSSFHDAFDMNMMPISKTKEAVDAELEKGHAVLASVNSGSVFTSNSHYVGIAKKNGNQYYIINTATKYDSSKTSNWYSEEFMVQNVINVPNENFYTIYPKNCSEISSSTSSSSDKENGRTEDDHLEIFPNIKTDTPSCPTIFVKCNGDLTEFGEFMNTLYLIIRIATPILVILLSSIDYIKAIASSNADDLKKTNKRTIKRIVIGLIIFFLPMFLDLLFHLFGLYNINTSGIGN